MVIRKRRRPKVEPVIKKDPIMDIIDRLVQEKKEIHRKKVMDAFDSLPQKMRDLMNHDFICARANVFALAYYFKHGMYLMFDPITEAAINKYKQLCSNTPA